MRTSELLAEVRQIPGYDGATGDNPRSFYRQVYDLINSRREEISQFIRDFKPSIGNPFDTIDRIVTSTAASTEKSRLDIPQSYQRVQSDFTSIYSIPASYLDFQIRVHEKRIDNDTKLVKKARSVASAKKDRLVIDTLLGMAQEWETEIQQTAEVLEQLKALRELISVYARAALSQYDQLTFLLNKFEEIDTFSAIGPLN